jgi:uncharacterized protein YcbX
MINVAFDRFSSFVSWHFSIAPAFFAFALVLPCFRCLRTINASKKEKKKEKGVTT